jgi:hypothetical protein
VTLTCRVRGAHLAADPATGGAPAAIISFFDERRAAIDHGQLGPWTGDFAWREDSAEIAVPLTAREAILAIGLHGGTGTLDLDNLTLSVPDGR